MSERQFDNPAKSTPKKIEREKRKRNILGWGIVFLQGIVSAFFLGTLIMLDMMPAKYLAVVALVLVILLLFAVLFQKGSKAQESGRGRKTAGKILSMILILALGIGSFYIEKVDNAVGAVTGSTQKIDSMAVAVLADDPAETVEDARNYLFGVQYQVSADRVRDTIEDINQNLGTEIQTKEFQSVQEQAGALLDGTVKAIIYNEGYNGVLEEIYEGYESKIKIIYHYQITTKLPTVVTEVSKEFSITEDCFSVYISGIDVYGPISTNSRSDVNIIATVNPATHQILLTTTPRDYYVVFPGVTGGQKDKLTHAGIYGVDTSIATLENLYDTEIQFYARVNFTSVIEIVDQLGGIDVYSEYAFSNSDVTVKQGMNHLNGKQALAFSRERYQLPGGDNQRGKNQQAVIVAIIKKMLSPQMLMNAGGIIDSVSGNVETNMSEDQIQELIKMQLDKGGAWNIYSVAATGTGDSNYTYSMPGTLLYVMNPDTDSVNDISGLMKKVYEGEKIGGSEVAE